MSDTPTNTYDELPYESHPYQRTHPDHLASMATFFGMTPPAMEGARVLELGCAGGGNLIPAAVTLPETSFVGFDLSRRQLEDGWALIEKLGLENIELKHRDILEIGEKDGKFDYIICHGVYSWVPEPVRDKILELCATQLSPAGVAYISYNVYPGWSMRGMVREMMCFHARQFSDARTQVAQGRALLDFLIESGPGSDEAYHMLLKRELEVIRNKQDWYLYHDHLEEVNDPVYFYEFNDKAESHGLRYLSEVQFSEMVPINLPDQTAAKLKEVGNNIIHSEQYLDFLRNRTFRRTLLCHKDIELNRHITSDQLKPMLVTARLEPAGDVPLTSNAPQEFKAANGMTATVSKPLLKATLSGLFHRYPAAVAFESLPALAYDRASQTLVRDADSYAADLRDIGGLLLELYSRDLVQLQSNPPRFSPAVSEKPRCSKLAQVQAESNSWVTNLRHEITQVSDLDRRILRLLDGENNHDDLLAALLTLVESGEMVMQRDGQPVTGEAASELLSGLIPQTLEGLARAALLVE